MIVWNVVYDYRPLIVLIRYLIACWFQHVWKEIIPKIFIIEVAPKNVVIILHQWDPSSHVIACIIYNKYQCLCKIYVNGY